METWKNRIFLQVDVGPDFSFQCHRDKTPTANTFSTRADLNMTMPVSPDVDDCGFKMAATKPELEITLKRL